MLMEDVLACLTHYVEECGGEGVDLEQVRAWMQEHPEHLHKMTNAASEAHVACSSFFGPGGAEKGLVMQRDGWTIEAEKLELTSGEADVGIDGAAASAEEAAVPVVRVTIAEPLVQHHLGWGVVA